MKQFAMGLIVLAAAVLFAPQLKSADEKKESKVPDELQGGWRFSGTFLLDGGAITGTGKKPSLTITGTKAEWEDNFDLKAGKGTVTVDTSAKPARIELKSEKACYKGVYKITDKKYLKVAFSAEGGDFPTDLKQVKGKVFTISFLKFEKEPTKQKEE
jgi:uncharacterized protein (TIGR03067 family)